MSLMYASVAVLFAGFIGAVIAPDDQADAKGSGVLRCCLNGASKASNAGLARSARHTPVRVKVPGVT